MRSEVVRSRRRLASADLASDVAPCRVTHLERNPREWARTFADAAAISLSLWGTQKKALPVLEGRGSLRPILCLISASIFQLSNKLARYRKMQGRAPFAIHR